MQYSIKRLCSNHFPTRHISFHLLCTADEKAIKSPAWKRCSEVEASTCGSLLPSTCSMQKVRCLLFLFQVPVDMFQCDKRSGAWPPAKYNPSNRNSLSHAKACLHSMGHPQISSLLLVDHLRSKSQTAALGMPAVQLSADDTKSQALWMSTISSRAFLQKFTAPALFSQSV